MQSPLDEKLTNQLKTAQFFMLRYETEYTPCTGITAVTKQERRHFTDGVMIAPWCPRLKRDTAASDPLSSGKVVDTGWQLSAGGLPCRVLMSNDAYLPILFLEVEGRFQGFETPYDIPITDLRTDTLFFGLAVKALLTKVASPSAFVWGADWECVPALLQVQKYHSTVLTLHNTFDECLAPECAPFGRTYKTLAVHRGKTPFHKTALEVGLEQADVVTTVNRGFAWGMRNEPIQTQVMVPHLQHLLKRVVGVNNAAFISVDPTLADLATLSIKHHEMATEELFSRQQTARGALPESLQGLIRDKVILMCMGRRVAQKQHDVVVEAMRGILANEPDFPLLAVFATIHGDESSPARLARMQALQREFPSNVICEDGRLPYYATLMKAADFNCMASLYEPHGAAFEGAILPIARAVDGLAEQICGWQPLGEAARLNTLWHAPSEPPTGLLFREPVGEDEIHQIADLHELLASEASATNRLFGRMIASLQTALRQAVELRLRKPQVYAAIAFAAIDTQQRWSWEHNLEAVLALVKSTKSGRIN